MKRFKVFGLCLIASFAFSAMVAVGAQAKGEHGPMVVTSSGGLSEFGGGGKGALHSPANHGGGEFTTGTKGTAYSIFEGVELESTGLKCTSAGEPAGDVKTETLTEETGWITKPSEAGVDFKAAATYLAQFNCGGTVEFKVTGSAIGQISPLNTSSLTSQLNLRPNAAKTVNSPEKFETGARDILESSVNGASPTESYQQQENVTVTNHGNSSVCKVKKGKEKCKPVPAEINTVYNPAQPEIGRCEKAKGGKYSDANCTDAVSAKGKFEFYPAGS